MRYLITGVDTGVGKTMVGSALLSAAAQKGLKSIGIKPVESGCPTEPSHEEDGVRLAQASGQSAPRTALLRLEAPVAPPLAAEQAGVSIDLDQLLATTNTLLSQHEFGLVEGAGGLLSPITWTQTAMDMARVLKTRAIVVAADRLGVIGQVQLVLSALRQADIPVDAVVISSIQTQEDDHSVGTNITSLKRIPGTPPIFPLPFCASETEATTAMAPVLDVLLEGSQS